MNLTKKIVSLAAATALVAGAGAMAAAPAQAKGKTSGTTLISLKADVAPLFAGVVAVAPAKKDGPRITFPVTGVVGNSVEHGGALKVGALEVSDPIIIIGENKTASVTVNVASLQTRVELFTLKNFKPGKPAKKGKTTTTVWRGFVHLTSNPVVVGALNQAAGAEVFSADMGLGGIRTTIIVTK